MKPKVTKQKHGQIYKLDRVSATKNLVFEFCPEGKTSEYKDGNAMKKKSNPKKVTGKRSSGLTKIHTVASATNYDERNLNLDSLENRASLPGIKRRQSIKNCSIDREVEAVKSDWQVMKEQKNFVRGKYKTIDSRTKKLYDNLEKMNCKIDKMQFSCLNRGVSEKTLKDLPDMDFEEEAERMKKIIFAKGNVGGSGGDAGLEELHRRLRKEKIVNGSFKQGTLEEMKRSWVGAESHSKGIL